MVSKKQLTAEGVSRAKAAGPAGRALAKAATKMPASQCDTPDRKTAILQAAEKLFAARGYHGVSIRDIADAAGVPLALVGYYYGPKLSLYHAIFRAHAAYIDVRLQSLKQAQQQAGPEGLLTDIVRAFALPVLQVAAQPAGRDFLRLLSRGMSDQLEEDEPIIRELFDPLAHAFIDAIALAMPGATRSQAAWCYQFALGAVLHHVNDQRIGRLSLGQNRPGDASTAGPLLVQFIAAGMQAACAPVAPLRASATRKKATSAR
jgi:AcrR family transcriptional regulator